MNPQNPFSPLDKPDPGPGVDSTQTDSLNNQHPGTTQFISNAQAGSSKTKSNLLEMPSITLPKGGGAIKSIDEKLTVNVADGSLSYRVPLPFSMSRNRFMPSLSLAYNTGSGNSPFGLGWMLDTPCIQRKTERKLPEYKDAEESDVFIFSGVEDLVPELIPDGSGGWMAHVTQVADVRTVFYRPRIEGSFARIERIEDNGNVYWRTRTKDNVVSVYGFGPEARLSSPVPGEENHTFRWCLQYSYDDKGSFISYTYKKEDGVGVPLRLCEKNRENNLAYWANLYLKSIRYGNKTAFYEGDLLPLPGDFLFETTFDYGEHDADEPTTVEGGKWTVRMDPYSSYRSGFEIRCYRLCKRVLQFHHFKGEFGWEDYLVRSLDFSYDENTNLTYLSAVTQTGYIWNTDGSLKSKKSLPPLELSYFKPGFSSEVKELSVEDIVNAPMGVDGQEYRWTDLFGEGISGILSEKGNGWFYKENLGEGKFSPVKQISPKPSFIGLNDGILSLQDLDANGRKCLVKAGKDMKGYFSLNEEDQWKSFYSFETYPNIDLSDPNLKFLDLNGDGMPDMLLSLEQEFIWYASKGTKGYDDYHLAAKAADAERGPRVIFSDKDERMLVALADMTGDGLDDIVLITHASATYYPNLGYGRFGARVNMEMNGCFDSPGNFQTSNIYLSDIDGSGATDIVYIGQAQIQVWFNQSGNSLNDPSLFFNPFPPLDSYSKISFTDLLGTGTSCLVWSSCLPGESNAPLRYIDLMNGTKPHILYGYKNNMGKEVNIVYKSSTHFYLRDKERGRKWITKLPFPVQCVHQMTTSDKVSQTRMVTVYSYHHGYYDTIEREFRGFALVEQRDTEEFDHFVESTLSSGGLQSVEKDLYQPVVITKSWFHTGAFLNQKKHLHQLEEEYYPNPQIRKGQITDPTVIASLATYTFAEAPLPDGLSGEEAIECFRSLKGMPLRQEVYSQEGDAGLQVHPYTVSQQNYNIQMLQPKMGQRHAVFLSTEKEKLGFNFERNPLDPRITHTLNIQMDPFGNVLQSASVAYGRKQEDLSLPTPGDKKKQTTQSITYSINRFTTLLDQPRALRLPLPCEEEIYELNALPLPGTFLVAYDIQQLFQNANLISYEQDTAPGDKRKTKHSRTYYFKNDLTGPMSLGKTDTLGITYENQLLAFTPTLLAAIYGGKTDEPTLRNGGSYIRSEGDNNYWVRSGKTYVYPDLTATPGIKIIPPATTADVIYAKGNFYLPVAYEDNFGNLRKVSYDPYKLLISGITDALDNQTLVDAFNYRTLAPYLVRDSNDNRRGVRYDELSLVTRGFVMGKATEFKGDLIDTTTSELSVNDQPTSIVEYEFRYYTTNGKLPNRVKATVREKHYYAESQPQQSGGIINWLNSLFGDGDKTPVLESNSVWQVSYSYSDGSGHEVLKKIQAEPGEAPLRDAQGNLVLDAFGKLQFADTSPSLRWVGNGRIIYNNKGNPVKQYEPFFDSSPEYNTETELVQLGFTSIQYYDALSRLIRKESPNGTFSKNLFNAWGKTTYDENDTVNDSSWYTARIMGSQGPAEQEAATKASVHYNTPSLAYFDVLGRPFLMRGHNKTQRSNETLQEDFYYTRMEIDMEGNIRSTTDARGNAVMSWKYDMLGNICYQLSMDAGERFRLQDVMGRNLKLWDSRKQNFTFQYDELNRPLSFFVNTGSGNTLFEKNEYGETLVDARTRNLKGKIYKHYDSAGVSVSEAYDFKNNPLVSTRQLVKDYKTIPDWSGSPVLETDVYNTETSYDALNRPVQIISPDSSILVPLYNEANFLDSLNVNLKGSNTPTSFITAVDYNAKGQREQIYFGNQTTTRYEYEPETYRLIRLLTTAGNGSSILQDLTYTFDPVGNITRQYDNAQKTIFYGGQQVDAQSNYRYDALYRLVEAEGREHTGQITNGAFDNFSDDWCKLLLMPNSPVQLRNYVQKYVYDGVGNMLSMQHIAGGTNNWKRSNQFSPGSNQLQKSMVGSQNYTYSYNEHGSINYLPNLSQIDWNFREEMQHAALGGAGDAFYVYDSGGKRVRKVIEKSPTERTERIYLGIFEIYRTWKNGSVSLERETFHVMDMDRRIALVETLTKGKDGSPKQLIRYQYSNHLDNAALELDDAGKVITYEEYHPYGTTSYQATDSSRQVPSKRYRYTAMERDDETGLNYHSQRYYIPWLGRWLSADPSGIEDTLNVYQYVSSNPIRLEDPGGLSGWDRFMGGLKMVGGALETTAGAALFSAGVATSEIGVGFLLMGAGALVTAHGADVTVSGARTMWNGAPVDSFTSQGLQSAGMSRTGANLLDAGFSVAGTLGAGAITRAPAAVSATVDTVEAADSAAPSVSLAFKPGLPGHNMVGVNLGGDATTVWSDLRIASDAAIENSSGVTYSITGETSVAIATRGPNPALYSTVTVPVTAADAQAAMTFVDNAVQTSSAAGTAGSYSFLDNSCSTYASGVLDAAGVVTPRVSSPLVNYVSVALQSPDVVAPIAIAGATVNTVVGANSVLANDQPDQVSSVDPNAVSSTAAPVCVSPVSSSVSSSESSGGGPPDPLVCTAAASCSSSAEPMVCQ